MATRVPARARRNRKVVQTSPIALEIVQGFLAARGEAGAPESVGAPLPLDLAAFARHLYKERRARDEMLGGDLFGDPMWDLMLELYAAAGEGEKVSVSSACAASGAPASSAIRYIKAMTKRGLLVRDDCPTDARRVYVRLSNHGRQVMTDLLNRMARDRLAFGLAGK
jgi:DNA-binding MarR family transcriptional regulator